MRVPPPHWRCLLVWLGVVVPAGTAAAAFDVTDDAPEISGAERERVEAARERIAAMIKERADSRPTHFLSFPLNVERVMQTASRIVSWCEENQERAAGFDKAWYIGNEKLHLSISMLYLRTEEQLATALSTFKEAAAKAYDSVGTTTLMVVLRGLRVVKGSPDSAKVVALDVEDAEGKLAACAGVRWRTHCRKDALDLSLTYEIDMRSSRSAAELMCLMQFHATVLNSKYAGRRHRAVMDATALCKEFDSVECEARVGSIEFSRMGGPTRDDGFYHSEASIHLP